MTTTIVLDQAKLAEQLADNVDKAFPQFVTDYETVAYSIALRFLGHHDEAVDICAEAFHRAYKAFGAYSPDQIRDLKLRPWLVTVVLNLCRNAARSAARRPREVTLDETSLVVSDEVSPEQSAVSHDSEQRLAKSLLRLSDQQRAAVVLHHVVGLPFEEVAEVLTCPVSTARSHAARGLTHLRKLIGSREENY